jgi:hypothetical protein
MFGRVRMYEAGFLIFVLGSLTCALAWNHWLRGIRRKRRRAATSGPDRQRHVVTAVAPETSPETGELS